MFACIIIPLRPCVSNLKLELYDNAAFETLENYSSLVKFAGLLKVETLGSEFIIVWNVESIALLTCLVIFVFIWWSFYWCFIIDLSLSLTIYNPNAAEVTEI